MALPMLPWFPANFLAATRGWSVTAKGVYRELLDAQWELRTLPSDPEALRLLIGATAAEWADGWSRCSGKFGIVEGGLRNARLEEHRVESDRLRNARVEAANRTNAQRRGHRDGERVADRDAHRTADRSGERATGVTVSGTPTATVTDTSTSSLLSSPLDSRVSFGNSRARPRSSMAFHQEVIGAYHELLPDLPRVKVWSKRRAQALDARIRERCAADKPADTLAYWRDLFGRVAQSDFLCGRAKTDFRADLEWLVRPENFAKVIEGRYANRRQANGGPRAGAG